MLKDNYALIGVGFLIAMIVFVLMRQQAKEVEGFGPPWDINFPDGYDPHKAYDGCSWGRNSHNHWRDQIGNFCSRESLGGRGDSTENVCDNEYWKNTCEPWYSNRITDCLGPNWRKGYAKRCNKTFPELSTPPTPAPTPNFDYPREHLKPHSLKVWAEANGTEINRWCVDNKWSMRPGQHCEVDCSPYIHGFKKNTGGRKTQFDEYIPKKRWQRNERGRRLYRQQDATFKYVKPGKNPGSTEFNGDYSKYCEDSGFTQK